MFKRRTLFILGAGASAEAGLPIGSELKLDITDRLAFDSPAEERKPDHILLRQLQSHFSTTQEEFLEAAARIQNGLLLANSIDDFLDIHRGDQITEIVGKTAIITSILEAEHYSKLYIDRGLGERFLKTTAINDTWYVKLIQMMCAGVAENQLPSLADHISFIVFNYDRCLEQFLFRGLKQLYGLSDDNAAAIVRRFKIIHPYGTVGELKILLEQPKPAIPFGGYADDNYVELAGNIKTYTEQVKSEELERDIQIELKHAECVVFLGFGFHETNIALLNPGDVLPRIPIFATGTGLSPSNIETIRWRLRKQFNHLDVLETEPSIRIERHLNCRALLDEFEKRLLGG